MEGFLFEIQYFSVLIEHFAGFAAVSCNCKLVNNRDGRYYRNNIDTSTVSNILKCTD